MSELTNKGFAFEYEVAEKLKGQGFSHIKVTKASRDYGADILAYKDGLEYVVQCKKYNGTVGFDAVQEISTAMEIYRADRGILICDTKFSKNALKAVEKIDKPIELIDLEQILSWKFEKKEPIKYKPQPFQSKILSKLIGHRKNGNKSALLVMATGLGKTLVAAWDLKNQLKKGEKALFLVHRKDILVDNAEKFYTLINEKGEKFKFGIYFEGKRFKKEDIVFSTFQTIVKHHKDIPKDYFDYIIIDEAHHSPASTYASIIDYFKPKFILGITATPKRITKQDNEFIETTFGKPLVNLDLAESLIRGYLSPVKYSVFCDNIDYDKLKTAKTKLSIEQLNKTYFIPTKDEDIENIILKEMAKTKNAKTIIFCPSIRYINSVKAIGLFKDAEIYHSKMSDFDRSLIFRRFKLGKIKTLLVVDLFNEGIDIPDANLVVFLRTTYSPTVYFQQLGRGLRKYPGKKCLRVLDFVGALKGIRKVINSFGHLMIVQDFVEKIENQKKLSNIYKGGIYKATGLLEPLELDFYQAGKQVKHKESLFRKKDFLSEIKYIKKHLIKSEGWTEKEIIIELKNIITKTGSFPTKTYLEKNGRNDLAVQAVRQGGLYYFARKLGYFTKHRPENYWNNWENLKSDLLPLCKKYGGMPSFNYLVGIGRNDLAVAIVRKWGGSPAVANKMGYEPKVNPSGYWDDLGNFRKELEPEYIKLKTMPTLSYLKSIGKKYVASAISEKGGRFKIAERLGYVINKQTVGGIIPAKPRGYYKNLDNLKKELTPICKQHNGILNIGYLKEIGRSDLFNTVHRMGIHKTAMKLGFKTVRMRYDLVSNDAIFKTEMYKLFKSGNAKLSWSYLNSIGRKDLEAAIRKRGGINKVTKELGIISKYKPAGYYDIWENVKNELLPICEELNNMPTVSQLLERGLGSTVHFIIKKWGGFQKVAKKLGYELKRNRNS